MSLRLNAIALLVAACGLTLAACQTPHAPRQLLAAQSFGSVEAPKQPKTVTRAEWGPRFTSLGNSLGGGNKKLLAFLAPQQPNKPADVKASRFAPKATSTTDSPGRKLHAAQSFGSVEAPKQPKTVTRAEWGPKFTSLGSSLGGNKKLLAFLAPQQPNKPADVKASRFAPKATSASTTDSPGRHLLAAQAAGATQAPKQPNAVVRKDWGPKFPAAAADGDRK